MIFSFGSVFDTTSPLTGAGEPVVYTAACGFVKPCGPTR
jgi:hypothetical protein